MQDSIQDSKPITPSKKKETEVLNEFIKIITEGSMTEFVKKSKKAFEEKTLTVKAAKGEK